MSHSDPRKLAGFVPAYNAGATVAAAVASLRAQQPVPLDVLVIDDASVDGTFDAAEAAGARVVRMPANAGRGAVRARGVELLAEAEFIVSLDAGNRVPPDFVASAMPLFADPTVAAVVGAWSDSIAGASMARRWRARHLFKQDRQPGAGEFRYLATHGCILRRSAVLGAGNFNPELRHTEDATLGWILQDQGWKILACPGARVEPLGEDGVPTLARRYWRWHAGARERWSVGRYLHGLRNAFFVMAPLDWRARDIPSLLFTLIIPHWEAWLTLSRRLTRKVQK